MANNEASFSGGGIANNSGGTVNLTNSTVMSNVASFGNGGGLYNNGGIVTLTNSTVTYNRVGGAGGGLYNNGGTLILTNSTVTHNNSARDGGGLYNNSDTLTLTNSTVTWNTADSGGGGLLNFSGTVNLTNSTVANNTATLGGGGLENGGTMKILDSTMTENSAVAGGGLRNDGTLSLTNSTVTKNSAFEGGGIDNAGSALSLTNSTVAFNTASEKRGGGGLFTSSVGSTNSSGSIIAANAAEGSPNCLAAVPSDHPIADLGYNLESGMDCGFIGTGSLQDTDPKLASLADNGGPTQTLALLPGSPAIDAIPLSSGLCPATDQRGVARLDNHETACDIGAYEFVDNAAELVNDLINQVNSFHLGGIQASFDAQLQAVLADLAHTTTPLIQSDLSNTTTKTACEDLHAFINHVQAQSGKHLTQAQAAELIAAARQIQAVLGC